MKRAPWQGRRYRDFDPVLAEFLNMQGYGTLYVPFVGWMIVGRGKGDE